MLSVKHRYTGAFVLGRTTTCHLLVILVGVTGNELAIPGSAVECFTTEPNPLAAGSWSISPRIHSQIMVPLRQVYPRNGLLLQRPTPFQQLQFVQRLITARAKIAKQRWSNVLRWPSGPSRHRTCVYRCQTLTGRFKTGG